VDNTPANRKEPVPYMSGEDAIKHLTLPAGCKVELVATEETFPELVNPVQMNFDTKGRLWIAAWPTYPETTPTTTNYDKLLVFDLDPKTGKATKCTTFADGLNCPTGFQLYKDGVIVMQSPDLWYMRDTDGDGKADWKERVLHGLDSVTSPHALPPVFGCVITIRLRVCVPPPQFLEQEDHSPQSPVTQSTPAGGMVTGAVHITVGVASSMMSWPASRTIKE
jgi:hypothetical protein